MSKREKTRPQVEMRTEDDYLQAELRLSQAMGHKPKRFHPHISPPFSPVKGAWVPAEGTPLPAWARDDGAAFKAMVMFQCYPSSSTQDIFIQWGIDFECVDEAVARHASPEAALRYAITLAATECANQRHHRLPA